MSKPDLVYADERRFLDERGSSASLAPNGENPATIMEKAVRERIIDSYFYKEQCFAVNEADIVDRVVEHVTFIGGTSGVTQKPTPFLCLAFKLLQLAPSDEVLETYLGFGGDKFKYLRALACFYVRMTRKAKDVYLLLEPFLEDRRKLRRKGRAGTSLTFMDDFVDDLLTKTRVCATSFRELPKRVDLVDLGELEERISPLGDIDELLDDEEENGEENAGANGADESEGEVAEDRSAAGEPMDVERSRSRSRSRSRNRSP
ncbi:PRP38 family protein [Colletotrichum abscissum]|uniref:Pre-mRNA-splicing factor 38 n=3 Tax=Colletotrichum acutatum species complex TaxID=2707335 RepID=A0A9Q0B8U1_9PEZI|nr:PRP38 family protein [Colletotrichum abscissum]KAI3528880.1 PRP38 family protein [Colletotrichum filicis]KAK0377042.1 PRP38 family protein [Colletotrichum limetticola]KAK1445977.1 PRP38 family protein [Colletotrichum melonis]KAI3557523.1 PRP38 family protein [Colletotrichum abscissum]KAK1474608.1 PRP38 family protein [Colletotrichum abscissum]